MPKRRQGIDDSTLREHIHRLRPVRDIRNISRDDALILFRASNGPTAQYSRAVVSAELGVPVSSLRKLFIDFGFLIVGHRESSVRDGSALGLGEVALPPGISGGDMRFDTPSSPTSVRGAHGPVGTTSWGTSARRRMPRPW
jgi:hypothetical protein